MFRFAARTTTDWERAIGHGQEQDQHARQKASRSAIIVPGAFSDPSPRRGDAKQGAGAAGRRKTGLD